MANPQPYVVSYSFGDFQANSPSTPLPGASLDGELAAIAAAVESTVSAIADVRRSDGALQNGIVTFDSLASGLQFTFDPTNGNLVAAAVAGAQASATAAAASNTSAAAHDTSAAASAVAAAASAAGVNLANFLPKAGNLAGLGSTGTARQNLGLGSSAIYDVGVGNNQIVQLDGAARLPAVNGSLLTNIDTVPIGTTIWVNDTVAPAGFLKENGALVSRSVYPRLWAFANASSNLVSEAVWAASQPGSFSTGDLSTTFRLPDSRGQFVRGYDDGRGVDSGRIIGSSQADSLKDHTHSYNQGSAPGGSGIASGSGVSFVNTAVTTGSPSTGAAAETRPKNIAKLACIKAY